MQSVGLVVPTPAVLRRVLVELAVGTTVAGAISVRIFVSAQADHRPGGVAAYLFALLIAAALPVRHRAPLGVLLASVLLLIAYHALGSPGISPVIPLAIPLYAAAVAGHLRWAATAAAAALTAAELFPVLQDHQPISGSIATLLPQAALLASLIMLGETVRSRRALTKEAQHTARRAVLEREREANRRVTEERLRIARELHDVLAHTLAGAAIQASVAAETLTDDPATSREALKAVRAAYREARAELAATVGVLRAAPTRADGRAADRSPVPGLAQLDTLLETARSAGLQVAVTRQGEPRDLPPAVDMTAYRIVQESLTNVVQHADAQTVKVELTYRPTEIIVSIVDNGSAPVERGRQRAGGDDGFGILGMRERATALGGRLTVGRRPEGGFQVAANLPSAAENGAGG
jgi:signal transduction histidine kinase